MQRYTFPTRVAKIEPRQRAKRSWKQSGVERVEYEQLGYFVVLDKMPDGFRISDEDPGIAVGTPARLIIEIDEP
jgi:hypothetical protein